MSFLGRALQSVLDAKVADLRARSSSSLAMAGVIALGTTGFFAYQRLKARARTDQLVLRSEIANLEARLKTQEARLETLEREDVAQR